MIFPFDEYEKYVKPKVEVEVHEDEDEDNEKLFEVEDEKPETPQVVIPEDLKASLMAEIREQLLKELSENKEE